MKNILIKISIAIVSIFFVISGCKDKDNDLIIDNNNEIVFEDLSLKTNISPYFYDNHFYLIEKLGNNDEKAKIINTINDTGVDLNKLNISDVKKFHFNNSEILMFSIPFKNSENKIIVYKYDNIFQVNIIEFFTSNKMKYFAFKSLDNELFYSFQLDKQNRIGNFIIEKNKIMNSFSNNVYSLQLKKHLINNKGASNIDCCRHASGWSDCMDCTVSACSSSWACSITFAILPVETAAGFAVSCIGAGPNTFC